MRRQPPRRQQKASRTRHLLSGLTIRMWQQLRKKGQRGRVTLLRRVVHRACGPARKDYASGSALVDVFFAAMRGVRALHTFSNRLLLRIQVGRYLLRTARTRSLSLPSWRTRRGSASERYFGTWDPPVPAPSQLEPDLFQICGGSVRVASRFVTACSDVHCFARGQIAVAPHRRDLIEGQAVLLGYLSTKSAIAGSRRSDATRPIQGSSNHFRCWRLAGGVGDVSTKLRAFKASEISASSRSSFSVLPYSARLAYLALATRKNGGGCQNPPPQLTLSKA